jgi:hypothetical protein
VATPIPWLPPDAVTTRPADGPALLAAPADGPALLAAPADGRDVVDRG